MIKVVIVDDSILILDRLKVMLAEIPSVEVIGEAGDKDEAVKLILECKPDVAILDIRMPGGSGIEVLKIIKDKSPEIMVMMLTNYPYQQYRDKCKQEGCEYFFDKATEMRMLEDVLRNMAKGNVDN
ncbi:MAG: response regulator transcription factor [Candidatus Electryonea clarkiae]|nr:response regulator transcription factor [Candidatus Electryonea clarkiae]MDP8288883.1 response regulator transcription factor [Candidatus Electryonea clarkiae]